MKDKTPRDFIAKIGKEYQANIPASYLNEYECKIFLMLRLYERDATKEGKSYEETYCTEFMNFNSLLIMFIILVMLGIFDFIKFKHRSWISYH